MIKGINLIPDEVKFEWRFSRIRFIVKISAVIYIAVFFLLYLNQTKNAGAKLKEISSLNAQKQQLTTANAQFFDLHGKFDELKKTEQDMKKRVEIAASLDEKKLSWSAVLKRLSVEMPTGIWLKNFTTSDEAGVRKIKITGSAMSNKAISDFIFHLENMGFLHDVLLGYSQKKDLAKAVIYDFEITANLTRTEELAYE